MHDIPFDRNDLYKDMMMLINRVKNIESDSTLLQRANDFQALYLRNIVNRDKSQWAIVGYQLELLVDYIFKNNTEILRFREIEELIEKLKFENVRGPERGQINKKVRTSLESGFSKTQGISVDLFRKRIDRIIWELAVFVTFDEIIESLEAILAENY